MDPVVFRIDDYGVTAVFPTLPSDINADFMTCYSHIGQHGGCSRQWYYTTRLAKPDEYAALKTELERIGYEVAVKKRITRKMDDERRANAKVQS